MTTHRWERSRRRSVWLSPYLLAVALSPALVQTASPLSCRTGDTSLSELAVIVDNEDQIAFDPGIREYGVRLTPGADTALVRAFPTDPSAQVWVNVFAGSGHYNAMAGAVGGGEATVPLELGMNTLRVSVKASGGASDFYEVGLTRDGRWGDAEHIGGAGAGNSGGVRIAADPSGHAVAVWYEFENGGYEGGGPRIWSSGYVPGLGWGVPERIGGAGSEAQSNPSVTMSADGAAIAVWRQAPPASLWANRHKPGEGWGVPVLVAEGEGMWASDVASDAIGNAVLAWSQLDGTRGNIWASRYVVGEGWGAAALIEHDDTGTASVRPRIAVGPNGEAMTAWTQRDGTEFKDWWNRYTVGQGWGSAQLVEGGNGPGSSAHMGIDQDGRAIAVGPQYDGERSNLSASRYTPGEGWHAAELIESDIAQRLGYVEFALHSNGNAMAVWSTFTNIWANYYEPDVGWGEAERIETNGKSARLPHLVLDAHGNAVAAWNQYTDSEPAKEAVWVSRYVAGQGWGVAELISGDGSTYEPRLATDADGRALIVWDQSDNNPLLASTIWGSRFE